MRRANQRKIFLGFLVAGLFFFFFSFSLSQERFRENRERSWVGPPGTYEVRPLDCRWIRPERGNPYAPGEALVKFKPSLRAQLISPTIRAYGAEEISKISGLEIYRLKVPERTTVEEMVFALSQNPDVEYAEPNYKTRLCVTPNDKYFDYQYYLRNTGQEIPTEERPRGKKDADIKATTAWEETKGKADILIAILDTGVDLSHPDLKTKIYSGGRDFINNDFEANDDYGHGTAVASVAAAETDNSEGIAGVAWNSKILPVKIMDENGEGVYSDLIAGIKWAVDNRASVVNLSLGGDEPSSGLRDALKYAHDKGVVVVAAAGNDSSAVLYPAAYDDYCLAIAATDYEDKQADWSNFGSQVDVAAPGVSIICAVPTWFFGPGSNPYGIGGGTSLSTPQVAGLAALLKALKPWLSVDQVMDVIRYSADDVNSANHPGKDNYLGYGRINMEKALVPIRIKK